MPAPPLRLAVFDVDGTLVDSQHNIVAAMAAAFAVHGLTEAPAAAVRRVIGLSLVEAVAALLPASPPEMHLRLAISYKEAFFELRKRPDHHEPLYPGALAALTILAADGWLLGVATGKSQRGVRAMIERHGLDGRFLTIQTADEHPGKPHPAMLIAAMSQAGASPDGTVMVGDTAYDMLMARNARTAAIGVAWGYHAPAELRDCGAASIAEEYAGLPGLLRAIAEDRECAPQPS